MDTPTPSHPRNKSHYPETLVRQPLSGSHRQTFILLHGRGSNGMDFGPQLLSTQMPGGNLATAFPHAKFIFPTASKRRAKIFKRIPIHQWFDTWSLEVPEKREELQNDGLRESSEYIHGLLRKEVEVVGGRNVVLGGLSQGCAASLVALLLWEGEPLAAGVGMCGYLPYRKRLQDIITGREEGPGTAGEDEDEDDVFSKSGDEKDKDDGAGGNGDNHGVAAAITETSPSVEAVAYLREELEVAKTPASARQPSRLSIQDIPLFLGHGTADEKVSINQGRSAASCLEAMKVDVQWQEYLGLGHWYSGDMLGDMIVFLQAHTDWQVCEESHIVSE